MQKILYADDTILTCTHACPKIATTHLRKHLAKIENYYATWDIKINADKSELAVFRPESKHCFRRTTAKTKTCTIDIQGKKIVAGDTTKYLGVTLDTKFSFRSHTKAIVQKAQMAYAILKPLMTKLDLDPKVSELMYRQLIRPILTYVVCAWGI